METKRIILRKFQVEDANEMFNNWASDKEVTKYLTWNTHESVYVTKKYLADVVNSNVINFAIVYKETNEVIGSISNCIDSTDNKTCEIGYCLSKKYWNKGIMTEATSLFLNLLFNTYHYELVLGRHMVENAASGKVLLNNGFKHQYSTDHLFDKFGWVTLEVYSITKEEYITYNIISKMKSVIGIDVPLLPLNDIIYYLSFKGFIVNKVNTIDSDSITKEVEYYNSDKRLFLFYDKKDNIRTYYFIAHSSCQKELSILIDEFISNNIDYIISKDNKLIESLIVSLLSKNNLHISFSESCTGGMLASRIVNVPGASYVLNESYVTYSIEAKKRILGVSNSTIEEHTVYSKQCSIEMAKGVYKLSKSEVCVSITGLAGGSISNNNDGSYDFCILVHLNNKEYMKVIHKKEYGLRNVVRAKQSDFVLFSVYKFLLSII